MLPREKSVTQKSAEARRSCYGSGDVCGISEGRCPAVRLGKARSSFARLLILGLMAGAFIAFAGATSNMGAFNLLMEPETFGLGKILSGTIFTGGLIMVVLAGAELFTGNSLMTVALAERRITPAGLIRNWIIVYIANFAGSVFVAWLVYNTGIFSSGAELLSVNPEDNQGYNVRFLYNPRLSPIS